ncbi:sugar ABC transporter ATP-binding protein [Aeromicrobium ginsengisoli]|uniref:Sugar ABC transporter ATP-binding protein n=1 Tax=Aeromicrobium ginsengisoli TaxID=363867 RepID=A0A5M4FCB9_9ACTN|nr:sugar ABC transporter ATP-binding protein [Aeromicrobium ginsengisoli]KAA1396053.1 sugar ABC transporter ATP-binding protein [Aeromicrobium ginsengisoli]
MTENMTAPALRLSGLTKRFAGQLALDHVDLELAPGEVRGLVGENGAGKSTLIKMLAGIYVPDDGAIEVDGQQLSPTSDRTSIAFVHQDLGLVDELTIGENIAFASGFPRASGLITWSQVWDRAVEAYERMNLVPPSPRQLVGRLSAAEKALLGIVRALAKDAKVAVLDEPTASLPAPDVAFLLDALRSLKASGTAILYVTHRLQELYEVADSVTILRGGQLVAAGPMAEFGVDRVVEAMLGRSIDSVPATGPAALDGTEILGVDGLAVRGAPPVSFSVHAGEVVGIMGLRGAGQEAIGRAIAGVDPTAAGSVRLDGRAVHESGISARMRAGIALLPADRQRESTFPGMSVAENLFPGPRNRSNGSRWIGRRTESSRTVATISEFDVRPALADLPIDQFSGGNQQKVCVARVLGQDQRVVILEEPTAGVDVGSKFEIHAFIRAAAAAGTGVVVISSDVEEITQLCTRVLVVVNGGIDAEATGDQISEENLIVLASSAPVVAGAHAATERKPSHVHAD